MDFSDLGKRIRNKREAGFLTQEELGEKIGVTGAFIGMVERAEREPSLEVFVKIANGLNATADELLSGVITECSNARLAKYSEKIANMNSADAERLFAIIDIALNMGKE